MAKKSLVRVPVERIEKAILVIRGVKAMLDADLAAIYGVETRTLNQAFQRNRDRFPEDFAFQLSADEFTILRSQFATSSWGGRRYPPFAFTEHGAVMLASVLNSEVAVQTSVEVVRAFVRLREMLVAHKDLARRLDELERKYNGQFATVFDAIRKLMTPVNRTDKEMGFHTLIPKR
jgi:ORF6N domain-containing protein